MTIQEMLAKNNELRDAAKLQWADFKEGKITKEPSVKVESFDMVEKMLLNAHRDFSKGYVTVQETLTSTDTVKLIPKVIEGQLREAAEPEYLASRFFKTVRVNEGNSAVYVIPIVGEVHAYEVAEGARYNESSVDFNTLENGTFEIRVKKYGCKVSITEEAVTDGAWDIMGINVSKMGRAMARMKEELCLNAFSDHGHVIFDNALRQQMPTAGTTGRDQNGNFNDTMSTEDFLDLMLAMMGNDRTPTDVIMHPLTWVVFARNSMIGNGMTYGAFGAQQMHPWGATQGTPGFAGLQADMGPQKFIMSPDQVQGRLPMPIKVNFSPFVKFDKQSKTFDMYILDASDVGVIAQKEALTTDNWTDPERDIRLLKCKERYGVGITDHGRGIVPKRELSYICGNPPFVGAKLMSTIQKEDLIYAFDNAADVRVLDFVTAWYIKAAKFVQCTSIRVGFVSTNSIVQGEHVPVLWSKLFNLGMKIDYAYLPFKWNSEASDKAAVICVIVGFSDNDVFTKKKIFTDGSSIIVNIINPYLSSAPIVFVKKQIKPLCDVPKLILGNMTYDDGNLILSEEEKGALVKQEPALEKWIKPFLGATEFLHNKERYAIWLESASPKDINASQILKKRVEKVKEFRLKSSRKGTLKGAEWPYLFLEITQKNPQYEHFIMIPRVSSEKRRYIPIGFLSSEVKISDAAYFLPRATLYHFGILTSNIHNSWMRVVCGRLKSDYRYSNYMVYNTFPWPCPTDKQKAKIEQTAQAILDARALYPDNSLADLYDEVTMPPELRKAHQQNDKAVMEAYGFWGKLNTESECVAELMKMYQQLTAK